MQTTSANGVMRKRQRKSFTPEENKLLKVLVQIHGTEDWNLIAAKMMGRTARQCKERWCSYLSPMLSNAPWTEQEEERLKVLVKIYGNRWTYIARYFNGRSDSQVKNRWYSYIVKGKTIKNKDEQVLPLADFQNVEPLPEPTNDEDIFYSEIDNFWPSVELDSPPGIPLEL